VTLPNLDSGLLQEGRINPNLGQINALISPGINNYNSLFVQLQRRLSNGLPLQASYTFAKNMMSNGVDFNNQFDFSNTHAPYLLDQRHRLVISAVHHPFGGKHFESRLVGGLLSNWMVSTVMLFSSGRPYAALLDNACTTYDPASGGDAPGSIPLPSGGGPAYCPTQQQSERQRRQPEHGKLRIGNQRQRPESDRRIEFVLWTVDPADRLRARPANCDH
jgi:hypothetical protein